MKQSFTPIDLAKAYGKHDYQLYDLNYRDKIINHPMVSGLFSIGQYFVLVGNMKTWEIEFLGGNMESISGYREEEILNRQAAFLMEFAHPDHNEFNLNVVTSAIEYLQSRPEKERDFIFVVYFYKARKKSGEIITIQHQSVPILFDEQKFPYVYTNILTDISHLKISDLPQATLINRARDEIFHMSPETLDLVPHKEKFTAREKEVIRLLIKGCTSRIIAEQTGITYETVRTHRKNILKKSGLHNTTQLAGYAITRGII